ncbi:MAG TPA: 30S ribosome-binding factor RbfA [Longimicrobiales bacterium]
MARRLERLNEQIKREISEILRSEVKDPRVGLVTVTEVRAAPDLSFARVYVRPLGGEEEELFTGLQAATPYIRRELGKRLSVRHIPEIRFEADRALEHALHIEKLLSEVLPREKAEPDEVAEAENEKDED